MLCDLLIVMANSYLLKKKNLLNFALDLPNAISLLVTG